MHTDKCIMHTYKCIMHTYKCIMHTYKCIMHTLAESEALGLVMNQEVENTRMSPNFARFVR